MGQSRAIKIQFKCSNTFTLISDASSTEKTKLQNGIHMVKKIKKKNRWEHKLLEKTSGKGKTGVRSCMTMELK